MRENRFIGDFDFSENRVEIRDRGLLNQIFNVLRLTKGDEFVLCNLQRQEVEVTIQSITKHSCTVILGQVHMNTIDYEPLSILYCAILKKENFELVVQKTTEIGISVIVPVITIRTVKLGISIDRLHRIAKEAAEQSGRGIIPTIGKPLLLQEAFEHAKKVAKKMFFCDPSGSPFEKKLSRGAKDVYSRAIFIGPEGGWEDKEIEMSRMYGMEKVSLGKTILRAETAAIIATHLVLRS